MNKNSFNEKSIKDNIYYIRNNATSFYSFKQEKINKKKTELLEIVF